MNFLSLIRWLVLPLIVCRMGGDDGGGGDTSGSTAKADEDRKQGLRDKINALYGIGKQVPIYDSTTTQPQMVQRTIPEGESGFRTEMVPASNFDAEGNYTGGAATPATRKIVGYQDDPEAAAARASMDAEDKSVSDATRNYYSDQLTRSFAAAERNNRFSLARNGLQGGSADVDTNAELATDQNLGATRIDQAARAAAASLEGQREQERLNATNLVNAGAGEDAVNSASIGLKNSLNNVNSAQRADLTSDLFTGVANTFANSNLAAAQSAFLPAYQKQLAAFFPSSGSTSAGRVTPSG